MSHGERPTMYSSAGPLPSALCSSLPVVQTGHCPNGPACLLAPPLTSHLPVPSTVALPDGSLAALGVSGVPSTLAVSRESSEQAAALDLESILADYLEVRQV